MKFSSSLLMFLVFLCNGIFVRTEEIREIRNETGEILNVLTNIDEELKDLAKYAYRLGLPYAMEIFDNVKLSSSCLRSGMQFLSDLMKFKGWALKMLDSAGKPQAGMLKGTPWMRGDYDQCLNIVIESNRRSKKNSKVIRGKFCSVMLHIKELFDKRAYVYENFTIVRIFKEMLEPLTFEQYASLLNHWRLNWRFDICIPSTCSESDLENIFTWIFGDMIPSKVFMCKEKGEERKFSLAQLTCIGIFGFFIIMVIIATIIELLINYNYIPENNNKGNLKEYVLAISIRKSYQTLCSSNTDETIACFSGLKFLLVCIIVFAHSLSYRLMMPALAEKPYDVVELFDNTAVEIASLAITMIETFFFISGFLVFYNAWKIEGNSIVHYLYFLIKKYIRFTVPIFGAFAAFLILPQLGDGPVWHYVVREAEFAEKNWWKFFVHIQNFYQTYYTFTEHFWFLHALLQLTILTVPIHFIYSKQPKIGTYIMIILTATGVATHVSNIWLKKHYLMIGMSFNMDTIFNYTYNNYDKPYFSHLSSYCFGLLLGSYLSNNGKVKFGKITCVILWILSVGLLGAVLFGMHGYRNELSLNETIILLHKCVSPFAWTAGLAWLCVACITRNGGIVNSFLSANVFIKLNRLSVWLYMLHPVSVLYVYGQLRNTLPFTELNLWIMFSFMLFFSLILSTLFYVFLQSPFIAALKMYEWSFYKNENPGKLNTLSVRL
ncbi:nose resistant to fluoxetine protein 6-like isoform X2 [Centruroides vittatus]|uniref:nose resistant to fluoxetine protein 6-like isoform X2 n=1 Tax=Centruroides vittatus TaxID=120091 RepID=UPI0035102EB2